MSHTFRSLHRNERGVYSIELLGLLPFFILFVLAAFQLAMIGGAMNAAENSARNGSRMAGLGGSAQSAALDAVEPGLRDKTTVSRDGETVTVRIDVPFVLTFIDSRVTTIERSATLPSTATGTP